MGVFAYIARYFESAAEAISLLSSVASLAVTVLDGVALEPVVELHTF